MTPDKAIHNWLNTSFGLPFYPTSAVPSDISPPYGTYELTMGTWGSGENSLILNLWFCTESEAKPNDKAMEIARALGVGGKLISCDGGAIWVKTGSPFCQALAVPNEPTVKRRYINLTTEFFI